MNKLISITALGLVAALSALACGSSDSGDDTTAVGGSSPAGVGGVANSGGGAGSTSVPGGGGVSSSVVGGNSAAGGATAVTTTTPVNTGDADTAISAGEFSFFIIGVEFLKSKAPGISCDSTGKMCSGALGGNLGGLEGADALCTEAAKAANPGDNHLWRAYLSTSTVNAIDRIGSGPWYSAPPSYASKTNYASEGLLFASSKSDLTPTNNRPGDSTTIVWKGSSASGMGSGTNNYPFNQCYLDQLGVCVQNYGDSHDIMTGTKTDGTVESGMTCSDWTSNATSGKVALGHSWPRTFGDTSSSMNWSRSNESEPCGGTINLTSTMPNNLASAYQNGVGSGGGYGSFYCFAYSGT
jgi:hypothetical protein